MGKKLLILFLLFLLIAPLCIAQDSDEFEGINIRTESGPLSIQEIEELEASKNFIPMDDAFYRGFIGSTFEENSNLGTLARWFIDIPNPFTYDQPKTKEFFNKVDLVQGTDLERIKQIYYLATEAVPNFNSDFYSTPGNGPSNLSRRSTFEKILSCGKGICRDQAVLLNAALQKSGINSTVIAGYTHTWVRVLNSENATPGLPHYPTFDLDPTWYKDFVALTRRGGSLNRPLVVMAESKVEIKEDPVISPPDIGDQKLCSNENYNTQALYFPTMERYQIVLASDSDYKLVQKIKNEGNSALKGITGLDCITDFSFWYGADGFRPKGFDLTPIGTLTALKTLYLDNAKLSDIGPLKNLENLEELALYNNHYISNISSLGNLTKLKHLDLSVNPLSNISSLKGLRNLEYVNLDKTLVTDISPLRGNPLKFFALTIDQVPDFCPGDCDKVEKNFPNATIICPQYREEDFDPEEDNCTKLTT